MADKKTDPRIFIQFDGPNRTDFKMSFSNKPQPAEAQFEIAGRELLAVAEILRSNRLKAQLPVQEVEE